MSWRSKNIKQFLECYNPRNATIIGNCCNTTSLCNYETMWYTRTLSIKGLLKAKKFILYSFCSQIALFMAPILMCLFSIFGFYWYEHTPVYLQWMYHMSFFRAAFHNVVYVIYGMEREHLPCPPDRVFCYFSSPKNMLYFSGISKNINLLNNGLIVIATTIILLIITYFFLSYRLSKR